MPDEKISETATLTAVELDDVLPINDVSEAPDVTKQATVANVLKEVPRPIIIAVGDETTVLSTGTAKVTFRIPFAFTVDEVRASLTTAGTGAALVTVDINDDGTTILSTKITIDATEKTSETAAIPPVISTPIIADDSEITIDIDLVDTDNVAAGLKVYLIGHET